MRWEMKVNRKGKDRGGKRRLKVLNKTHRNCTAEKTHVRKEEKPVSTRPRNKGRRLKKGDPENTLAKEK